jgi:hypothetical protein
MNVESGIERPRNSFSGNIGFKFLVMCLCSEGLSVALLQLIGGWHRRPRSRRIRWQVRHGSSSSTPRPEAESQNSTYFFFEEEVSRRWFRINLNFNL